MAERREQNMSNGQAAEERGRAQDINSEKRMHLFTPKADLHLHLGLVPNPQYAALQFLSTAPRSDRRDWLYRNPKKPNPKSHLPNERNSFVASRLLVLHARQQQLSVFPVGLGYLHLNDDGQHVGGKGALASGIEDVAQGHRA